MTRIDDTLTPKEIQARLDEYVVGQTKAKRAVAVALRNRWRRRQLPPDLAADVYPKNILLIGPTGCGKTEIARRLAALARAPFVKVEASKYSEVGYVGRDVESMIRDLVDAAVAMVRREQAEAVRTPAAERAEERIFAALCAQRGLLPRAEDAYPRRDLGLWNPAAPPETPAAAAAAEDRQRSLAAEQEALREALRAQRMEDDTVEIEVIDTSVPTLNIMGPQGNDAMGIDTRALQEIWGRSPGRRTKLRRVSVGEARTLLIDEEADKLLDQDAIQREALDRAQNDGIVFVDEIDKIIGAGSTTGPDVSREGVQRDLLPIVEGCAVYTRYGHVQTEHVLFLAAGAFHFHKPSELIPELQGRFPVRVALRPLTEEDFVRILEEPRNSLTRQYVALFQAEGVQLRFTPDGVQRIAELAFRANRTTQNIGARRLMTILEKCLEDLSFEASELRGRQVVVDRAFVDRQLGETADDEDLIQYNL
ncbi:MAG: ATP-dependent protease ATPase subunit HslU [Planctomycetes bacterium]|nr:ATP-dependent protease ATPase subunit HslU [Planctomycetota bacterium]